MSELIPLKTNPSHNPVLLLDSSQPFAALSECADVRLSAAYGLVDSLTCMSMKDAASQDLLNVAEAVRVLLADASDLYRAARTAAVREGVANV